MGFVRGCWGSMRALGPQPCLEEHVLQHWFGDDAAGLRLEHQAGSALGHPSSPCPQPVPAAQQGPARRLPARGVSADHAGTGWEGWAGTPGVTRVVGGGCGTPGWQKGTSRQTLAPGGNPRGCVGSGSVARVLCAGEFKPQQGDRAETRWKRAQDSCGTDQQPHISAFPVTPL